MVSIEKALSIVAENIQHSQDIKDKPLIKCLHHYLAKDVFSPINMPPFNQSAMDGYAVFFDDNHTNNFVIIDESKAGNQKEIILKPGEAVRIFTGAPVPENSNAVIMQENTEVNHNNLTIKDTLSDFKNIRLKGEQIKENELALAKNSILNPAAIGFLATLGITKVPVYKKPSIQIIVTGDELISPGKELAYGQIYESNAIMLQTALANHGFYKVKITKVKDDFSSTKKVINKAIQKNDFVFISGGISVGDYDYVKTSLETLNVEQLFYKVKQKPGKPLYFGKKNNTYIFALPGNPASALTCYHVYAAVALQKYIGNLNPHQNIQQLPIASDYDKKGIRAEFLKAKIHPNKIEILTNQSSAMLNTYAIADALIKLPEATNFIKKGTLVDYILL